MCHISDDMVDEYALGRLGEPQTVTFEMHLLACHECQDRLELTEQFIAALQDACRARSARAQSAL